MTNTCKQTTQITVSGKPSSDNNQATQQLLLPSAETATSRHPTTAQPPTPNTEKHNKTAKPKREPQLNSTRALRTPSFRTRANFKTQQQPQLQPSRTPTSTATRSFQRQGKARQGKARQGSEFVRVREFGSLGVREFGSWGVRVPDFRNEYALKTQHF